MITVNKTVDSKFAGRIRFKFMPTPSGGIHLGHSWLMVLMDNLAKRARQENYHADVVLVVDDLTGLMGKQNPDHMKKCKDQILTDAEWLGIEFAEVVNNSSFLYNYDIAKNPITMGNFNSMAPGCLCAAQFNALMSSRSYYLKNCIIDAALGVTHIIRGQDQLAKTVFYKNAYELCDIPCPRLVYLPFVKNGGGAKISADTTYSINSLRHRISRDQLLIQLGKKCIKHADQAAIDSITSAEIAVQKILGEDWDWVLGKEDSGAKLQAFFNRVNPAAQISAEEIK